MLNASRRQRRKHASSPEPSNSSESCAQRLSASEKEALVRCSRLAITIPGAQRLSASEKEAREQTRPREHRNELVLNASRRQRRKRVTEMFE